MTNAVLLKTTAQVDKNEIPRLYVSDAVSWEGLSEEYILSLHLAVQNENLICAPIKYHLFCDRNISRDDLLRVAIWNLQQIERAEASKLIGNTSSGRPSSIAQVITRLLLPKYPNASPAHLRSYVENFLQTCQVTMMSE